MKKIGILTFHRSINYGAFLQAYSLSQQLIKRYGDVVEIIDFEKASKHVSYHANQGIIRALIFGRGRERMRDKFVEDLDLLPLSEISFITDSYDDLLRFMNSRYDIVIVGSDAVWAFNKGLGLKNPYWLFGDRLQCEKFSYAASAYSLNQEELKAEDRDYISSCLESFTYIGVRDYETEKLVKACLPAARVFRNCDPTVLLDKPNHRASQIVFDKLGLNPHKKLITIMMGVYNPLVYDVIRHLGKRNYQYVYLYSRMRAIERFMYGSPRFLYDLSPYEWYLLYGKAFLNVTTFFHGSLVALKSNVPTISIDTCSLPINYTSKIEQVFRDLDLSFFYNKNQSGLSKDRIIEEVDYIINNHSAIEEYIDLQMTTEAKKADSFFSCLEKSCYS